MRQWHCIGGDGATQVRHQLRADREQPPAPDAGVRHPPVAQHQQGEALRRRPGRPHGLCRHGRRVHRQRRGPRNHVRRQQRPRLGGAERAALPPGHPHHLHHRRQRGALRRGHGHHAEPPPRHAGRPAGAGGPRPRQPSERVDVPVRERARQQLPAVVRRVPGGARAVHGAAARLPRPGGVAVPHQRVPVLRLQGEPGDRVAAVRAVRAQPRRARPRHQPHLRQHAVRADRRRVRGHGGHGARRRRGEDLGDRVAVRRGRRRGGRHRAERRRVQPEPDEEGRGGAGNAAEAGRARGRARLRAVQREHEARAGVREELRAVLPQRHFGVRSRPRRRHVVRHVHVGGLLFFQADDIVPGGGGCPTCSIFPVISPSPSIYILH